MFNLNQLFCSKVLCVCVCIKYLLAELLLNSPNKQKSIFFLVYLCLLPAETFSLHCFDKPLNRVVVCVCVCRTSLLHGLSTESDKARDGAPLSLTEHLQATAKHLI